MLIKYQLKERIDTSTIRNNILIDHKWHKVVTTTFEGAIAYIKRMEKTRSRAWEYRLKRVDDGK